jgi:hypothetical protein
VIVPGVIDIRDTRVYQGLCDFKVHECLAARSSFLSDTDVHVIGGLLEDEISLGDTTAAVMADTEYLLLYVRALFLQPQRLRNLYLMPPLFHSCMHILVNTTGDPVAQLLAFLPFCYAIGSRRKKVKQHYKDILAVIHDYNRGYAQHNRTVMGEKWVDEEEEVGGGM